MQAQLLPPPRPSHLAPLIPRPSNHLFVSAPPVQQLLSALALFSSTSSSTAALQKEQSLGRASTGTTVSPFAPAPPAPSCAGNVVMHEIPCALEVQPDTSSSIATRQQSKVSTGSVQAQLLPPPRPSHIAPHIPRPSNHLFVSAPPVEQLPSALTMFPCMSSSKAALQG